MSSDGESDYIPDLNENEQILIKPPRVDIVLHFLTPAVNFCSVELQGSEVLMRLFSVDELMKRIKRDCPWDTEITRAAIEEVLKYLQQVSPYSGWYFYPRRKSTGLWIMKKARCLTL